MATDYIQYKVVVEMVVEGYYAVLVFAHTSWVRRNYSKEPPNYALYFNRNVCILVSAQNKSQPLWNNVTMKKGM